MKLRIEDQTVRFRLSPDDIAALSNTGKVIETLTITASAAWGYAIETNKDLEAPCILAEAQNFKVLLPKDQLTDWLNSHEIEWEFHADSLEIMIEKDLKPNRH